MTTAECLRFNNAFSAQDGGWIYAAQEDGTPLVKIGYTGNHPEARLITLKYEWHVPLTIIGGVYIPAWVAKVERRIHVILAAQRIEREWFYLYMNEEILLALAQEACAFVLEEQRQAQLYFKRIDERRAEKKTNTRRS